eukprot:gene10650-7580_t
MTSAAGVKILMFSDSFDRFMLFDRCENSGRKAVPWTDNHLTYFELHPGGLRCEQDASNSVSSLALFGSNATRPYFRDGSFITDTNIIDTKERIRYALNLYLALFPPPDFLFVHMGIWDARFFEQQGNILFSVNTVGHPDFARAVAQARKNYIERMEELYAILKVHQAENITRLALRSATYYPSLIGPERCKKDGKHLIEGYNDMLRELSRDRDWSFFDLDAEVWSTTRYDYSRCDTLRDHLHISLQHSLVYGKKLMGTRHSAYYWIRGEQPLPFGFNVTWLHPTTRRVQKEVFLVKVVASNASSSSSPSSSLSPSSPLRTKPNRLMPGSSLVFFSNSTLFAEYQAAEEAYEEDLFFITYDKTGQNPVLHAGAGPHFRLLFRLGEGDIYEATKAEIQHLPLGITVPAEFNQPDVWRRGVIVHVPLQQDARSAAITRSATTNADVVGICDEWFFVVRGSKHPIHVISEFAVHCKGSASRVAKGRGSIPLSTIVERLERVPQLAGRKRCRIHTRQFLAELAKAEVIHAPSVLTDIARQQRMSRYRPGANDPVPLRGR